MKLLYTATAKRWFDKENGNTYHSVRVTRHKDGAVLVVPFRYGYGEAYRDSAVLAMVEAHWIPYRYKAEPYMFDRENGYPVLWNVTDGLKRDCVANGQV